MIFPSQSQALPYPVRAKSASYPPPRRFEGAQSERRALLQDFEPQLAGKLPSEGVKGKSVRRPSFSTRLRKEQVRSLSAPTIVCLQFLVGDASQLFGILSRGTLRGRSLGVSNGSPEPRRERVSPLCLLSLCLFLCWRQEREDDTETGIDPGSQKRGRLLMD